jgi:plastocyanin
MRFISTKNRPRGENTVSILLVIIAIIIIGVVAYMIMRQPAAPGPATSSLPTSNQNIYDNAPLVNGNNTNTTNETNAPTNEEGDDETAAQIKEFTVRGRMFSFNPSEIRVKKGDTVKINFINEEGNHDWVLDEFNARTSQIQGGQTATVQFVADKTGTFEYYCSVGNHRQQGMKGNLIVE